MSNPPWSGSYKEFDRVFFALADPTRRDIMAVVAKNELSVTEVAARFKCCVSLSTVSRHLAILREAGIVEVEPATNGRQVFRMQLASSYEIERAFEALLELWKRDR